MSTEDDKAESWKIEQSQTYRYHDIRTQKRDGMVLVDDVDGPLAFVNGFGVCVTTRQEMIAFTYLDGPDKDTLFFCGRAWFAQHFRPETLVRTFCAPEQETAPDDEKVAGSTEGSGF